MRRTIKRATITMAVDGVIEYFTVPRNILVQIRQKHLAPYALTSFIKGDRPGERIRRLRQERNWNQAMLGKKLKVGQSAITALETGPKEVSAKMALKLGDLFQINPRIFLGSNKKKK